MSKETNYEEKINNWEEYYIYSYLFLSLWIIIFIVMVFLFLGSTFLFLENPLPLLPSLIFLLLSFIYSKHTIWYEYKNDKNIIIMTISFILLIVLSFWFLAWLISMNNLSGFWF